MGKSRVMRIDSPESSGGSITSVATNWLFFWLVAGITIFKDLIDVAFNFLEAATAATVAGIPVAIIVVLLGALMTITVGIITFLYHVHTRKPLGIRLVITSIGAFIGMLPIMNLLPEAFLTFCVAAFAGNITQVAGKLVGGVAGKVAGKLVG